MPFTIGEVEVVNEVALAPSAVLYDGAVTADGDLSIRVNGFYYDLAGTHGKYGGSVENAVVDNQTNYVYLDGTGLHINTTGYPVALPIHLRLARVVTQSGIIVRIILERSFFSAGGSNAHALRAGVLIPGNFAGNPKKATIVFSTAYGSTAYSITALAETDGSKSFSIATESKTVNGFTVNLHSNNLAGLVSVGWHTALNGE
jgi:hypothetical protein